MKSKLGAALAAVGCVLAVSTAHAVTVASHRGAITSSVPGAVLFDDFDSVQNTAIGTITGGLLCSGVDFGCGGLFGTPPATGNFLGVVSVDGTTTIATVTFTNPVSYAAFAWGTPDDSNEVDVYGGSTLLGAFFGTFNIGQPNQPTYYFDIHAGPGEAITKLVLSSNCCFETDNYSAIPASAVPGPIAGAGLPGLLFASNCLLGWCRRRRQSARTGLTANVLTRLRTEGKRKPRAGASRS
jgi:hypothetical protein